MAENKRGYWDYQQCRWVGSEASYVVPPAAEVARPVDAVAPVAEAVPAQRAGATPAADGSPAIVAAT